MNETGLYCKTQGIIPDTKNFTKCEDPSCATCVGFGIVTDQLTNMLNEEFKTRLIHPWPRKESWTGAKVKCLICEHKWTGVFPTDISLLECPHCGNRVQYEIQNDRNEESN